MTSLWYDAITIFPICVDLLAALLALDCTKNTVMYLIMIKYVTDLDKKEPIV